jgi:hypothetical protein
MYLFINYSVTYNNTLWGLQNTGPASHITRNFFVSNLKIISLTAASAEWTY